MPVRPGARQLAVYERHHGQQLPRLGRARGARPGGGAGMRGQSGPRRQRRGGAELQPHVRLRRTHGTAVNAELRFTVIEGSTFLRAIDENPDDDGPRLVYADWLEEHGDTARAEVIRVQCELARLAPRKPGPG